MKKTFCILLALLVLLAAAPMSHAAIVGYGTCGDYLIWKLDDTGTLTISGAGAMYDYPDSYSYTYTTAPWGGSESNAQRVKTVVIQNGVTSIGAYAFCCCSELTSVTIPDGVTSIGDYAFCRCSELTSVTIPNGVTSIGECAFAGCTKLTSATIPDSVTVIGNLAFYGCAGLTSVTIPNGVTSIWANVFYGCTGLTSVTIPDSVTSIWGYAFYGCTGLTSVTIPDSVTSIWDSAFAGCTGLTSVTIPDGVMSIGDKAFYNCTGLKDVYYGGDQAQWTQLVFPTSGNDALIAAAIHCNEHLTHTWDGGVITTAADCTTDGVKTYTCTVCGKTKTETIPAIGHSYGAWTALDDTWHQRVCANDDSHVEKENHAWDGGVITTAATCATEGEKTFTCTDCGATKTETIPAAEHAWSEWTNLDETLHRRVCANDPTHVETAEHTWDDGTVTTEPTEESEGVKTCTCTVCHATKTETIPKTNPEQPAQKPGDVDNDGEITSADARLALRASVGLENTITPGSDAYLAADADGDGEVTSGDARLILRASVGLEDPEAWGK